MPAENPRRTLLQELSDKIGLEEGEEGIRKILREIYRSQRIGTKDLAYHTQLPIPIVAAARKELEKEGLIARKQGAYLTQVGNEFAKEHLGLTTTQKLTCPACHGKTIQVPDTFTPHLETLRTHLRTRPAPQPWLDQAYGTPETALLRALLMLERGDVEGRKILFLGDDDFTSIAVGLLNAADEVVVLDIDPRLLEAVQQISKQENLNIECVNHDLRTPLSAHLYHRYDTVFTDPPYTIPGLTLFVSRGITALKPHTGAAMYVAFAHQPPKEMLRMQKTLAAMGLTITEQIPRFNTYEGAEMFANTTLLIRLETTEKTRPHITDAYGGKIYTGEITQTLRVYRCQCGQPVNVGATETFQTVEELKAKGCPTCGQGKGFKLIKRQKLKDALSGALVLRHYRSTDFPAILEFEREIAQKSFPDAPILDEDYHRKKIEKAATDESDSLKVALLEGTIVGWLWLKTEKDRNTGEKFGYIKSIIVKPEYRHQAFGRRLVKAADQHFLKKGVRRIDLIASATNHAATAFFEEVGFEREHSTMRKRLSREEA